MRRALARDYARQWLRSWPARWRELRAPRRHQAAWRGGYGDDARPTRAIAFEAALRVAELLGVGLAYAAAEILLAGGRYRRLTPGERRFTARFFSPRELDVAVVDEGARVAARRFGVAYVSGRVIKSDGPLSPPVLAHELTHTRQFARWGWAYAAKCLAAQWWGGGYGYPGELLADRGETGPHPRLNGEQEAARLEDVALLACGWPPRHARAAARRRPGLG